MKIAMKTLNISLYELRYMLFSAQSRFAFVALFAFAMMVTAAGDIFQIAARGDNIFVNAPSMITFMLLLSSVVAVFIVPSYMATTVLKDNNSKFEAILFATPITKNNYLFGRFVGAFTALAVVMAAGPLGMLAGTFWPWAVSDTLAPTNLSHYAIAYFGFLLPSMLVVSALVFAVATLTRSMMYCYITVLGLFILYVAGVGSKTLSSLWDPFMLGTFDEQIRYWSAAELNQNLVSYSGVILGNRIIWLSVAVVMFAIAYQRFSLRAPVKRVEKAREQTKTARTLTPKIAVFKALPSWNKSTHWQQLIYCTRIEMLAVLKSRIFILLMGFSLFLLVATLSDRTVLYGVDAYPVTRILLADMTDALIWAFFIVATLYGADVVWRDRENHFYQLIDATPTPNWVFVISKLAALAAVIYTILILGVLVAIGIQVLEGYNRFEFGLYMQQSLLLGSTILFIAVLSFFMQVLVKSRMLGIMLMGFYWLLTLVVFEHPLLRYALGEVSTPLSDMNGAGRFIESAIWVRFYYASVACVLVFITYALYNRGTAQPLRFRLQKLKHIKTKGFAVAVLLVIGSGSFVYYNTNVLNNYYTSDDAIAMRVDFEKRFAQFQNQPMPHIVDIKLEVDIYPYKSRIETRGRQILQNKTTTVIKEVHVDFPQKLAAEPIAKLEGAKLKQVNAQFGYYIFELDTPMKPGDKRQLDFETIIHNKGFTHRSADKALVTNGTFIGDRRLTPFIGFDTDMLLTNRRERRKAGLDPLPRIPMLEDTSEHNYNSIRQDSDFINFAATVSTVAGQKAVTSGKLVKQWLDGERAFFSYKSQSPMMNSYSFISAEYEQLKDTWQGVDINVLYHKPHRYNVERMMESAKHSLEYFSQNFGPYQFEELSILEFPAYRTYAQSFPSMIAYSEDLGFLADVQSSEVIDVPYYVTAHEVAHQWWSHQVLGANTQGASMLSETLAQYSALMVMEQKLGAHQIRQFLKYELDSYLSGRDNDPQGEVPLLRAEGQQYLHYRKGAVIMYALKDYLGDEVVNRALKQLVQNHRYAGSPDSEPYPTSADFLAYLKAQSEPEFHGLIDDFITKIILFDLKLHNAQVESLPDGRFKVVIDVEANKFYADGIGNQSKAVFDIPVDIGLFSTNPASEGFNKQQVIMLEKHQIADGRSSIEIVVDDKPNFVGIDPYHKLIDRDTEDNLFELK